jgi:hypothetical protein
MKLNDLNLSLDTTQISLIDLYNEGRDKITALDAEAEASKAFTLRAGSAGCVTESGNFIGANPWEVLGRFMGFQTPKTRISRDIFDHGFANEWNWEKYLKNSSKYEVTGDRNYPLTIENFVGNYTLTGRPDLILKDGGVPVMGGEYKVVAGSSSAEKVLLGSPKTENLCQAGVYSAGFQLPWVLVYTSYSNFKGYKAALPPGKAEYFIGWDQGRLYFNHKGVITETVIDVQGLQEYYDAIVSAYEAKDHSWFMREPENYLGEPEWFNSDKYNTFMNMVDCTAAWGDWVTEASYVAKSPVIIEYSTYKRQDVYKLIEHETMRVVSEADNLEDIRADMRTYW